MSDKHDLLVQIPIHEDDLAAWAENRTSHLTHPKPYIEDGTLIFGGPTLAEHPKQPGDAMKINSSVLMFRAGTEADVRAIIGQNVFVQVGVWDLETMVVTPFRCTMRMPFALSRVAYKLTSRDARLYEQQPSKGFILESGVANSSNRSELHKRG
ncbi:hypothetical protein GQ44DRAFT_733949 [Phaeosphaeriaceae sp. PMI808]|nr:hypothetical protein GQ44DRAFT_733949 [Phaeosphaeriaceae sp. PMI808]